MTENAAIVIGDVLEQAALPQWLNEAGALLLHLGPSGVPVEVTKLLRVQREGGVRGNRRRRLLLS